MGILKLIPFFLYGDSRHVQETVISCSRRIKRKEERCITTYRVPLYKETCMCALCNSLEAERWSSLCIEQIYDWRTIYACRSKACDTVNQQYFTHKIKAITPIIASYVQMYRNKFVKANAFARCGPVLILKFCSVALLCSYILPSHLETLRRRGSKGIATASVQQEK